MQPGGKAHTLDLANFPVTDTLKMLASLLEKITQANDHFKTHHPSNAESSSTSPSFTRFHARSVPSIEIQSYLSRILKYCPTTNECFLSLLVYFDRMSKNAVATTGKPFSIDSFNIHRLIIAGIMVSSKFFSDVFFTNSRYAKVGGLPVSELNQLELEFLVLNDFRLAISIEELQRYGDQLLKHWAIEEDRRNGVFENSVFDNKRFSNGSGGSGRWDPHSTYESKRSRRHTSVDDTHSSKGSGKVMKEEEQDGQHNYRGSHRRDSSYSSSKSLNIYPTSSTLSSSPQQYVTHGGSKTPPHRHGTTRTSPSAPGMSVNATHHQANANGSPMRAAYHANMLNAHYQHLQKPYSHHTHAQPHNHQRSMSLGSTIKRTSSTNSLLGLDHRSRSQDLTDDLLKFHYQRHSSPRLINLEDHAYRTAAPPPTQTPAVSAKYPNGSGVAPNGHVPPPHISTLMRRMSHESTSNGYGSFLPYPPPPPPPPTGTPTTTVPPQLQGVSFGSTAHNVAMAALNYARRASLALPPLPRHPLTGFQASMSSPISPVTPSSETIGPGITRRGGSLWNDSNGVLTNGVVTNGVVTNGVVTNGVVVNGVVVNGVVVNGVATNGNVHNDGRAGNANVNVNGNGSSPPNQANGHVQGVNGTATANAESSRCVSWVMNYDGDHVTHGHQGHSSSNGGGGSAEQAHQSNHSHPLSQSTSRSSSTDSSSSSSSTSRSDPRVVTRFANSPPAGITSSTLPSKKTAATTTTTMATNSSVNPSPAVVTAPRTE